MGKTNTEEVAVNSSLELAEAAASAAKAKQEKEVPDPEDEGETLQQLIQKAGASHASTR